MFEEEEDLVSKGGEFVCRDLSRQVVGDLTTLIRRPMFAQAEINHLSTQGNSREERRLWLGLRLQYADYRSPGILLYRVQVNKPAH